MKNAILPIAAGLLVVAALQVAGSAAASAPDASTSGTGTKVHIHLKGTVTGSQMATIGRGRFTLSAVSYTGDTRSGAISDRGTFTDRRRGCRRDGSECGRYLRRLRGAKGTFWVNGNGTGRWTSTCSWTRTSPACRKITGVYRGLGRGQGKERGVYSRTIDVTMTGTLWSPIG
jgi:hypothetical protein